MRPDNGILAGFQCSVEIGHDGDVVGNESGGAKRSLQFRREVDEDNPGAGFARRLLDLREALRRRGIDAGDAAEIENQEARTRLLREQRLDVLVEPIGRAEEQITVQRHALNLPAVLSQQSLLLPSAIERRAVLCTIETELDRVHATGA